MIKIKLLTIALSSALGVGGVTAAKTQWQPFDGPFENHNANHGNGNQDNGNPDSNNGNGNNGNGLGNIFGGGSCGD